MAAAAAAVGTLYLGSTDHSPRLTVAHGLDADPLPPSWSWWPSSTSELDGQLRILTGIEVDILEDGSLDQDEDLLAALDVVVASVHSKLRMEGPAMTERMLAAIENPHTDILGHCTGRIMVGRGRKPSTFDPDAVFAACARTGTAVEINSRPGATRSSGRTAAGRPSTMAACSASTPTPTPRAARMARPRVRAGRRGERSPWSASSTAGSMDRFLAWTSRRDLDLT